uniref:Uncharacterized protein n=1 Tax=Oryza nivara TaxID=4536 RepID=A0A0E0HX95_ORYNI
MPCVPAARGGRRKLLGIATDDGRQLHCGWPRKAVESGKTSCGGIWVSLRAGGGGGACRSTYIVSGSFAAWSASVRTTGGAAALCVECDTHARHPTAAINTISTVDPLLSADLPSQVPPAPKSPPPPLPPAPEAEPTTRWHAVQSAVLPSSSSLYGERSSASATSSDDDAASPLKLSGGADPRQIGRRARLVCTGMG